MILPAIYSGVQVLQLNDYSGLPVMRRASDDFVNATQILRAAGFPKTQRTKILEKEVIGGRHEKVQGGFHMFQGTWVPLETAEKLARRYEIFAYLEPLFVFPLENGQKSEIFNTVLQKPKLSPRPPKPPRQTSNLRVFDSFDSSSGDDNLDENLTSAEVNPNRSRESKRLRNARNTTPSVLESDGTPPPRRGPGRPRGSTRNRGSTSPKLETASKSPERLAQVYTKVRNIRKPNSDDLDELELMDPYGLLILDSANEKRCKTVSKVKKHKISKSKVALKYESDSSSVVESEMEINTLGKQKRKIENYRSARRKSYIQCSHCTVLIDSTLNNSIMSLCDMCSHKFCFGFLNIDSTRVTLDSILNEYPAPQEKSLLVDSENFSQDCYSVPATKLQDKLEKSQSNCEKLRKLIELYKRHDNIADRALRRTVILSRKAQIEKKSSTNPDAFLVSDISNQDWDINSVMKFIGKVKSL